MSSKSSNTKRSTSESSQSISGGQNEKPIVPLTPIKRRDYDSDDEQQQVDPKYTSPNKLTRQIHSARVTVNVVFLANQNDNAIRKPVMPLIATENFFIKGFLERLRSTDNRFDTLTTYSDMNCNPPGIVLTPLPLTGVQRRRDGIAVMVGTTVPALPQFFTNLGINVDTVLPPNFFITAFAQLYDWPACGTSLADGLEANEEIRFATGGRPRIDGSYGMTSYQTRVPHEALPEGDQTRSRRYCIDNLLGIVASMRNLENRYFRDGLKIFKIEVNVVEIVLPLQSVIDICF